MNKAANKAMNTILRTLLFVRIDGNDSFRYCILFVNQLYLNMVNNTNFSTALSFGEEVR